MATRTTYYHLNHLGLGDSVRDDGYKFGVADRDLVDLLLHYLFTHHHTGAAVASSTAPSPGPGLTRDQSFGSLPANSRIYYVYSLVDANGFESPPSPETFIDTPAALASPGAPVLTALTTGGTLLPGQYLYVLSAWKGANTLETTAVHPNAVTVLAGSVTNAIRLTLPALPTGADGFNVYRRKQSGADWEWLAEIDMNVSTPPSTWTDDGHWAEDCNRSLPRTNTTNAQNEVTVTLPGATPVVPAGYTWNVYRTLVSGDYTASLLHHVVEETSEGSGVITPVYIDTGISTSNQTPQVGAISITEPDPIDLTTETTGILSAARVTYYEQIEFEIPGAQSVFTGTAPWHCTYDNFVITEVLAVLNMGSTPASTDDIYDVNKWDSHLATPASGSIFSDQAHQPHVVVGERVGVPVVPDVTNFLLRGDELTVDCDQAGGGSHSDIGATVIVCGFGYKTS